MRVLVTGATGFLGTTLCQALAAAGHEVVGLNSRNADLTHADSLAPYREGRYEQIYHLAAWTQAGDFCLRHPGEQWIINQQINTHVLDWWQRCQRQAKLIVIGTSCAYAPELPLTEDHYFDGRPIDSLFTYAMTKRMLLAGAMALSRQYGLKYLCLVPSTLYGAGYHTDGRQMHFIFDLIRKILRGRRYGDPVVLWGDGHQKRELVHVDDFVRLTLQLVERVDNDLINLGAGREYSIREFAEAICRHTGYDPAQIQYDTSKYVGAQSKCLDVTKLRGLLPDLALTPLDEGLARTIAWFEQHAMPQA
jgi:GDP-L-fucose synthase